MNNLKKGTIYIKIIGKSFPRGEEILSNTINVKKAGGANKGWASSMQWGQSERLHYRQNQNNNMTSF